jgi:hypothetical protein
MRLPKARITLDLDQDLLQWVMEEVERTGKSRNEVIGDAVRAKKEAKTMAKYEGYKIYMTVFGGNLLLAITESINERESISRYAELCRQAIEQEYPGAAVEVDYEVNVSGEPPRTQVVAPDGDVGFPGDFSELGSIADDAERICDTVYEAMEWLVA